MASFYHHLAEKVALRLQGGDEYTNDTMEYIANCCDFHGCNNMKFYSGCHRLYKNGGSVFIDGTIMSFSCYVTGYNEETVDAVTWWRIV